MLRRLIALALTFSLAACANLGTVQYQDVARDANNNPIVDASGNPVILTQKMSKQAYITKEAMAAQQAYSKWRYNTEPKQPACDIDKEFIVQLAPSAQAEAMKAFTECQKNMPYLALADVAKSMGKEIKIAGGQPPTDTRIAEATIKGNIAHDQAVTDRIVKPIAAATQFLTYGVVGYTIGKAIERSGNTTIGSISQTNQAGGGKGGDGGAHGAGGDGLGGGDGTNNIVIGKDNNTAITGDGPASAQDAEKTFNQQPQDGSLQNQNTQNAAEGGPTAPFFDDSGDGAGSGLFGPDTGPVIGDQPADSGAGGGT